MSDKVKIAALVPMRHDSERVPGKNYRDLAGKPLFHHILATLQTCSSVDRIAVDTDSEEIKQGLTKFFPDLRIINRPEHLRAGEIPMNDILLHDTGELAADYYLQTHSTNPLLSSATIEKAISTFLREHPEKDSLFGVTELHARLYDEHGQAINHNPDELLRTQDLPPVYEENSCIYLFTRQTLEKHGHRIGATPILFPVPPGEALDIDEELDFQMAEFLVHRKERMNG